MVLPRCETKLVILLLQILPKQLLSMTIFEMCLPYVDDGIINPANLPGLVSTTMAPPFFTPTLVEKYIKLLKAKSGSGPDGLPAVFFKNTASSISYPLSILFNLSLQTADIPSV